MGMRVLVIDDSAFNRQALARIIGSLPAVGEVATAVDGLDGCRQAIIFDPDLIVLDLEMPNIDGLSFLRLRKGFLKDIPVIVASGRRSAGDSEAAFRLGAIDFIERPTAGASRKIFDISEELSRKIEAASLPLSVAQGAQSVEARRRRPLCLPVSGCPSAIAIGTSTGGPGAVSTIVKSLPAALASAVVVSMHMPGWMTVPFAEGLDSISEVDVLVAEHEGTVGRGSVLIVPGGFHISFERETGGTVRTLLSRKAATEICSPSIDRMFSSASDIWGSGLVGVVLTGMGTDGSAGAIKVKQSGGFLIAESRASSSVFSMPQAAIDTGMVDLVLGADEIAGWIAGRCAPRPLKLA